MMRKFLLALSVGLGWCGVVAVFTPVPIVHASAPKSITPVIVDADDSYQVPETVIVAPTKPVRRGHQVVVSIKPFDKPKGLLLSTYVWVISPEIEDWFAWPDNSKGSFGSGTNGDPVKYNLTLVANYLFVDETGKNPTIKTVEAKAIVNVDDPTPPPLPTPTPTPEPGPAPDPSPAPRPPAPNPTPNLPVGKYGFSAYTFKTVTAMKLPAAEAKQMAGVLKALVSQIGAGAITGKAQLVQKTIELNNAALGSNITKWMPFLDALATQMNTSRIVAVADCASAYGEVAVGLVAVI